jgi:hypothetical protein
LPCNSIFSKGKKSSQFEGGEHGWLNYRTKGVDYVDQEILTVATRQRGQEPTVRH